MTDNYKKTRFSTCSNRPPPDDTEIRINKLEHAELLRLRRAFRRVERTGDAHVNLCNYGGGGGGDDVKISKRVKISEVKRKEELAALLQTLTSHRYIQQDKKNYDRAVRLALKYERHERRIGHKLHRLKEASDGADKIVKLLVKCKLKLNKVFNDQITTGQWESALFKLENHLYHYTTGYGEICARNSELRKQTRYLLIDRQLFFKRHSGLRRQLDWVKTEMSHVVNKCHLCYEVLEETKHHQNQLIQSEQRAAQRHFLDVNEEVRIADNDYKIHKFHRIKNKSRDYIEQENLRSRRCRRQQIAQLNIILGAYKKSFEAIRRISQIHDISRMLDVYLKGESFNFITFRYNNDLNMEVTALEEEIYELYVKLEKEHLKMVHREEHIKFLEEGYKEELEKAKHHRIDVVAEWLASQMDMTAIIQGMERFLKASGSNDPAIVLLLGKKSESIEVKMSTLLVTLKLIEDRIFCLRSVQDHLSALKTKEYVPQSYILPTHLFHKRDSHSFNDGFFQPKLQRIKSSSTLFIKLES